MPNVSFVREELTEMLPIYKQISDCILGEMKVKDGETDYLPKPNAADTSTENSERYDAYVERAVFYNVTGRTLRGMVGQIYAKLPIVELPRGLEPVLMDTNGNGVTLEQHSRKTCAIVGALGRAGLLTDYPVTDKAITRRDLETGQIRPTITQYTPEQIINWRTRTTGAKEILSLVVIEEEYIVEDDGFAIETATQWRVLSLGKSHEYEAEGITDDPNVYTVEIWRMADGTSQIYSVSQPTDSAGKYLKEIPFTFVGSENNDQDIDIAPMYDISALNIAHYRNSADYEESSFMVGQPTPYLAGLTQSWVDDVLKGHIQLGSRAAIPLPEGGSAGLLQAESNIMPFEAMQHKERQMVALGAKLVEQATVQRTATEAGIENASENSVLSSIAKNVSAAYMFALQKCALFTGDNPDEIEFQLNTDFDFDSMTLDDLLKVVSSWQQGAISWPEMREAAKRIGVASEDNEEAEKLIAAEKEEKMRMEERRVNNTQTKD